MGPTSYMLSVVMRLIPVLPRTKPHPYMLSRPYGGPTPFLGDTDCRGKL